MHLILNRLNSSLKAASTSLENQYFRPNISPKRASQSPERKLESYQNIPNPEPAFAAEFEESMHIPPPPEPPIIHLSSTQNYSNIAEIAILLVRLT
jgi:hypothetical protein